VIRREAGQATVELVGVLPAVVVLGLLAWQLVLAGHTAWLAADAARVAARAQLVGDDPARAARSALPHSVERAARFERTESGAALVEVPVPLILPLPGAAPGVTARASLQGVR
jgi:hypothetical protein